MPVFFTEKLSLFSIGTGLMFFSLFLYIVILSYKERKKNAAERSLTLAFVSLSVYFAIAFTEFSCPNWVYI